MLSSMKKEKGALNHPSALVCNRSIISIVVCSLLDPRLRRLGTDVLSGCASLGGSSILVAQL